MRLTMKFDNLILLAIFMSPFSYLFTYKSNIADIRLVEVLWLIIFVIALIKKACNKEQMLSNNRLKINRESHAIFTLYIAAICISCLFSINITRSAKELFQYIYLFIIMYIVYDKSKDFEFFKKIVKMFICANILLVTICILSYIRKDVIIPSFFLLPNGTIYVNNNLFSTNTLMDSGTEILRLNGVLGLGATAIANQVIIESLFINYMIRMTSGKKRTLLCLLLVANLITIVFTYSRAGLILFFVVHLLSVMSQDHVKNIAIILVAILICGIFLSLFSNVQERLMETFNTEEQSSKYHFAIWLIALKTGYNNIMTGIGLGNMAFSYGDYENYFLKFGLYPADSVNVHNFLLQIWSEQGITGIFAGFCLFISPIICYIKCKIFKLTSLEKKLYDFIFLAFIGTLTFNLTNNNFYIEIFWILLGMVYSSKDYLAGLGKVSNVKSKLAGVALNSENCLWEAENV